MSKNTVIQEGGTPLNFSADELRTHQVGGGHINWVPKDLCRLTTKTITKDGTYMASNDGYYGYSQVSVSGIGRATGKKGNDEYTVTTEDGILVETKIPSNIQVTTRPTITTYGDGAYIDFSGIVVTAYDGSGNSMGVIPFVELQFPITVARISQSGLNSMTEIVGDTFFRRGLPNKGEPGYYTFYWRVISAESPVYTCTRDDSGVCYSAVFSKNYFTVKYIYQNGAGTLFPSFDEDLGLYVYWDIPSTGYSDYFAPPIYTYEQIAALANDGQIIPVQWQRPGDDKILETYFTITVIPAGGHGDD